MISLFPFQAKPDTPASKSQHDQGLNKSLPLDLVR